MHLLLPEEPADAVVYLPGDAEQAKAVHALMTRPAVLVSLPADWNCDLSPWSAPAVFRAGEDFSGGAAAYLERLLAEVIPEAEAAVPFPLRRRYIAGYSLAGLFAMWAAMQTDCFCGAASMSGSLWYDGFLEWTQGKKMHANHVYLSVGDREARTRNARMASVEECTRAMAAQLEMSGIRTHFALEAGGHFDGVSARIARGIDWIIAQQPADA
ncbi:MAG: hypothetical protein IJZ74_03310 [Clostridia bacterium]|nr:hypothetical protein [Clostridia bacterium]